MTDTIHARNRNARWGLLASALIMGVVLILIATFNIYSTRRVSRMATEGQAEVMLREIGLRDIVSMPTNQDLKAVLDRYTDLGLRYIAIIDAAGKVISTAGESIQPESLGSRYLRESRRFIPIENRLRLVLHTPPSPAARMGLEGPFRDRPPHIAPPQSRPYPDKSLMPFVVIEFEPVLSRQLEARATVTLVLSLVVSILLMAAALFFWRMSLKADAAEARSEHQRRMASLGEMSAVMAHEIRNPLGSLKGHAQLLAEHFEADSPQRVKCDQVVAEAVRLEGLTNDLLDFARPLKISPVHTSPARLIEDALTGFDKERFNCDLKNGPALWLLDPVRMGQVLVNLFKNGLQAAPDSTKININCAVVDKKLTIVIRDRGQGIYAEDMEKIFQPFHTGHVRGVGLGLAVSQRIVAQHKGQITVRNHPKGGAEFTVQIPPADPKTEKQS